MKTIKNLAKKSRAKFANGVLRASLLLVSSISFAGSDKNADIIKTLMDGSIGKTLSKDGYLWTVLVAITFAVGAFYAAIKSDPKAFIPAFIVMGLISTVTGVFLTF